MPRKNIKIFFALSETLQSTFRVWITYLMMSLLTVAWFNKHTKHNFFFFWVMQTPKWFLIEKEWKRKERKMSNCHWRLRCAKGWIISEPRDVIQNDNNTLISCDKFTRARKQLLFSLRHLCVRTYSRPIVHFALNWVASRGCSWKFCETELKLLRQFVCEKDKKRFSF